MYRKDNQGFDLLGYHLHPCRRLRPSPESIDRLKIRSRRLYEFSLSTRLWLAMYPVGASGCGTAFARMSRKGGVLKYCDLVAIELGLNAKIPLFTGL